MIVTDYLDGPLNNIAIWMGAPNQYGIKDGKLAPAFMFDEYLEALKFMNKCYNEGLINQDMATYSSDKWNEQFLSGKAGVIIDVADRARRLAQNIQAIDPNAVVDVFGYVTKDASSEPRTLPTTGYDGYYVFPKTSVATEEDLDFILGVMDKANEQEALNLMNYGIEGRNYDLDADGYVVKKDDANLTKEYNDLNQFSTGIVATELQIKYATDVAEKIQEGNLKELNLIVKADVQGSVEAVKQSLVKLSNDEVVVKVIHGGVGAINESDVTLASASNAIIIGFNVRPDATAKATAEQEGVDLRLYRVIYQAIEDVEAAMKGMLDPVFEEKVIGHAEVRQIFKASGVGNIAGSYVLDGVFQRGCTVRISREGKQIFEGPLASLKRFKDDVKEVKAGYECGLVFEGFNDIQELDQVEAYIMVEVPR